METDAELLRRYADEKAEQAFGALVTRHVDFVYDCARRRLGGDAHLAEDVTQQVFTAVARQAVSLKNHPALNAWLFTTTRNLAAQIVRTERRRQAREEEAHAMQQIDASNTTAADWERMRPAIDDALDELGEADRQAVLLRFFENRSLAEVGERLQVTENTARMRVDRALDRLQGLLARRGLTSTSAALAAGFTQQAIAAAPAGLAASVTSVALSAAAASGGTTMIFMSMAKVKIAAAAAVIIAGAAGLYVQHHDVVSLREQVTELSRSETQVSELKKENARLTSAATTAQTEHAELEQLRAEVATLRGAAPKTVAGDHAANVTSATAATDKPALAAGLVPVETLGNAGRANAREAWTTQLWAARRGDVDLETTTLTFTPEGRTKLEALIARLPEKFRADYGTPERLMAFVLSGSQHPVGGMQVLGETQDGPDDMILKTQWQHADDTLVHNDDVRLHRTDDGWKMVVPMSIIDRASAALLRGRASANK